MGARLGSNAGGRRGNVLGALSIAVAVLVAIQLGVLLYHVARTVAFPYDLNYGEGYVLFDAVRLVTASRFISTCSSSRWCARPTRRSFRGCGAWSCRWRARHSGRGGCCRRWRWAASSRWWRSRAAGAVRHLASRGGGRAGRRLAVCLRLDGVRPCGHARAALRDSRRAGRAALRRWPRLGGRSRRGAAVWPGDLDQADDDHGRAGRGDRA